MKSSTIPFSKRGLNREGLDPMEIIHINNIQELKRYRNQWSRMMEEVSESSSPFLTPDWVLNWWEQFADGHTLSFLTLFDGQQMVGIAPLSISRRKWLGFPIKTIGFIGA